MSPNIGVRLFFSERERPNPICSTVPYSKYYLLWCTILWLPPETGCRTFFDFRRLLVHVNSRPGRGRLEVHTDVGICCGTNVETLWYFVFGTRSLRTWDWYTWHSIIYTQQIRWFKNYYNDASLSTDNMNERILRRVYCFRYCKGSSHYCYLSRYKRLII